MQNDVEQRHKNLQPWAYDRVMNWVNENYGKLIDSNNYIANEIGTNLSSCCLEDNQMTQIDISQGYMAEELGDKSDPLCDLVFYFIALHVGFTPNMDTAKIVQQLKKQGERFLEELEDYKADWNDEEDIEIIQDDLMHKNYSQCRGYDLDLLVNKYQKKWMPKSQYPEMIKRTEEIKEGKVYENFINEYYKGTSEEFKDKLKDQGFDLNDFIIAGDDSGDYVSMGFSCIVEMEEFLEEFLPEQKETWIKMVEDSKILKEIIRREQFFFQL